MGTNEDKVIEEKKILLEQLKENNQKLKKQVEFLQFTCREAATKIKDLEEQIQSLTNPLNTLRKGGL